MSKNVKLKDVTAKNWRAVARLELAPDQSDLVADNLYSIAESKFDPDARPRAVYAGDEPVGFLMYDASDGEALIYRFMIDRRHQGKGYGRAALVLAIDEIEGIPKVRKVSSAICRTTRSPRRSTRALASKRMAPTRTAR